MFVFGFLKQWENLILKMLRIFLQVETGNNSKFHGFL